MKTKLSAKKAFLSFMSFVLLVAVIITSVIPFPISALTPTNPINTTQTGFENLITYQTEKWAEIATEVFGDTLDDPNTVPTLYGVQNNTRAIVQDDNRYFNWKTGLDASVTPWDGTTGEVTPVTETIAYNGDSVTGGDGSLQTQNDFSVTYTVYNVSNASELRYAITEAERNRASQNTKINLTSDIDLNGSEVLWSPPAFTGLTKWLYFEGNGYTIYNMKCYNTNKRISDNGGDAGTQYGNGGFFGKYDGAGALIIKNLNFSNCLSLSLKQGTSVTIGYIAGRAYLENINVYDSFVFSTQDQTGTLIGRTQWGSGDVFLRNCSSQNCYVYGENHSGGLTGCQYNNGNSYKVKYDAEFPDSPEAWMKRSNAVYPEMIENCYSVDCTLFSVGNTGDSGGFISCGGKFICRNSFTNNTVYGRTKTGAFLGRIVTQSDGGPGMYDDAGNRNVEIYFENCFSSGSIEGTDQIGGFVGYEAGIDKNYNISVYKNCYSTAMVGMDYAGDRLGGFIGHESTGNNQKATIKYTNSAGETITTTKPGSVYINCYAAGEVGNIMTDTNVEQPSTDKALGGFLGATGYNTTKNTNGTYINCYYDMQTTAMRERACGVADQFAALGAESSQIPGVTGVYTQRSDAKNIDGLTDTVNMGGAYDNSVTGAYPMLKSLTNETQVEENFQTAHFGSNITDDEKASITNKLAEKAQTVRNYSLASVSTVLLDHWDSVMNMDTGSLSDEGDWTPGYEANKMTLVSDGDEQWSAESSLWSDTATHYEITYNNLSARVEPYQFKIQEGTSWAYNFGSDKFNGSNCQVPVTTDCNITIRFKYDGNANQNGEDTNFEIWADAWTTGQNGEKVPVMNFNDGTESSIRLGYNVNSATIQHYKIVGSFTGWEASGTSDPMYNLRYDGNGKYSVTVPLTAAETDYEFKVVQGDSWAVNYGQSGISDGKNMKFHIEQDCNVTFTFDDDTHTTTITADVDGALTDAVTEIPPIDFEGYSLIGPSTIMGYEWIDGQESLENGRMAYNETDGTYSKTITVSRDKADNTYGYKVIQDGVDIDEVSLFHLTALPTGTESVEVTFTYNPTNKQTTVTCNIDDCIQSAVISYYSVLGVEALTGFNWQNEPGNTDVYDPQSGIVGRMTKAADSNIWTKTYTYENALPAGTYSFKVAADGVFTNGVSYGSNEGGSNGNYVFTITKACNSVTIYFDEDTKLITVETDPTDALQERDRYVVSGTKNLTGAATDWDTEDNVMTYDGRTGLYTRTYKNLSANTNYAFKVVKYGQDNKSQNIDFSLSEYDNEDKVDYTDYSFVVTYNSVTRRTEYHLYDNNNNNRDDLIGRAVFDHYSVIGDEGLTGYNWMGENNSQQPQADAAGRMTLGSDGKYSVTFKDVNVTTDITNLSFKVVAGGSWDTGISYGSESGDNYKISVSSDTVGQCDITIIFDNDTGKIEVYSTPDGIIKEVDESKFDWYVAGEAALSNVAYNAPVTVYDTVRDITADFGFTSGITSDKTFSWQKDELRNNDNGFFGELSFGLDYTVEGKEISGTFREDVVTLTSQEEESYYSYSCNNFMPGKQWLQVSVGDYDSTTKKISSTNTSIGNRSIRLIPTLYLEAGNDSEITVLQAGSDSFGRNAKNIVTYKDNSSDKVTFTNLGGNFDRYNFALTAGYVITDIPGLGYYGNYSEQDVITYDYDKRRKNAIIDDKDNNKDSEPKVQYDYFAMTSVYAQSAGYSDNEPLIVDELVPQSLIGSSYDANTQTDEAATQSLTESSDSTYAQTIVKVYKKTGDNSYTKVFMDSSDTESVYYDNYMKWTGQRAFSASDEGTYRVTYYWSLSDGRYRTDSKEVEIAPKVPDIDKKIVDVDGNKIEKSYTENIDEKIINYSLTFTNEIAGDFKILDILPFSDDVRYDSSNSSGISSSTISDTNYSVTLENINVDATFTPKDSEQSQSLDTKLYYTNTDVSEYYNVDESGNRIPNDSAAQSLNTGDGTWNVADNISGSSATAIALTGTQSGEGTSTVTITYTIKITNGSVSDLYLNDAFFSVNHAETGNIVNGYSNLVSTAVVGRNLSGYTWLDSNGNGRFDEGEPVISGVKVELYNGDTSVKSTVSNNEGYYEFDDISSGGDAYKIKFSASEDSNVTIMRTDSFDSFSFPDIVGVTQSKGDLWLDSDGDGSYDENSEYLIVGKVKLELYEGDNLIETTTTDDDGSYNFNTQFDDSKTYSIKIARADTDMVTIKRVTAFADLYPSKTLGEYPVDNLYRSRNIATQDEDGNYFIDETLPTTKEIFDYNNMGYLYGNIDNYLFSKGYQNLALSTIDINNLKYGITIKKVDDISKNPLEGVVFKLEYFVEDTQSWTTLSNADSESGNYTTNKDGIIEISLLREGKYRITEVEAKDGYVPLAEPIEITLNNTPTDASVGNNVTIKSDTDNNYHVTVTVENAKIIILPELGGSGTFIFMVIGITMLTAASVLYVLYRKKPLKAISFSYKIENFGKELRGLLSRKKKDI